MISLFELVISLIVNKSQRATIALCAIVARQSTRQFTQRDTHNQNVCIVTMRAGDGYWLSKHSERNRLIVRRSHRITAGLWGN